MKARELECLHEIGFAFIASERPAGAHLHNHGPVETGAGEMLQQLSRRLLPPPLPWWREMK